MHELPDYWQAIMADEDELEQEAMEASEIEGGMIVAAYVAIAVLLVIAAVVCGLLWLALRAWMG